MRLVPLVQAYLVECVEAWQRYRGRPVAGQRLEANRTSHRCDWLNNNPLQCRKQSLGPNHFIDGWDTHHTDDDPSHGLQNQSLS